MCVWIRKRIVVVAKPNKKQKKKKIFKLNARKNGKNINGKQKKKIVWRNFSLIVSLKKFKKTNIKMNIC